MELVLGIEDRELLAQDRDEVVNSMLLPVPHQGQGAPMGIQGATQRQGAVAVAAEGHQRILDFGEGGHDRLLVVQQRLDAARIGGGD